MAMKSGIADYIRFSKRAVPSAEESGKVSLLPSLWFGDTCRALAKGLNTTHDPEKQLRKGQLNKIIDDNLPKKISDYEGGMCVFDIGRAWRKQHNLDKWQNTGKEEITWKRG